jgi:hypothetical protein
MAKKIKIALVSILVSVFLFQNCATIMRGTSQKIPVTSSPQGAKITVDGKEAGYTPLTLELKRREKTHIIVIEKEGYNPFEIRITRESSPWGSIVGNYIVSFILSVAVLSPFAPEPYEWDTMNWAPYVVLAAWGALIIFDHVSGGAYVLSPEHLLITLSKIEDKSSYNSISIDAEHFQNIKWIKIKCADSKEKEIIILKD